MNEMQLAQFATVKRVFNAGISKEVPTEAILRTMLEKLRFFGPDLEDHHFDAIFDEISTRIDVSMELGNLVEATDHKSWLKERRASIDWRLWTAYSQLLTNQGRPSLVIDKLDQSLDVILDHLGDPEDKGDWARKGLVIGDVQSGKTGTYIGLMDKAADAGYRYFILLTGNTESLRQQTQSRVDQGVIGRDSLFMNRAAVIQPNQPKVGIGALLTDNHATVSMTTMTTDFRKNSQLAINFSPGPEMMIVFVTKKNKTVLDEVAKWIGKQAHANGKVSGPLLLLDDESDYASVNTKVAGEDPTAINKGIRTILGQFSRSSYVGFTATPFANIFIDDEDESDLFPSDFIYGLEAPSNYIGPQALFGESGEDDAAVSLNVLDDAEVHFPIKHKNSHIVGSIPESLCEAVRTFIVANAIRDLRQQNNDPRSMLINVSRFNFVQNRVFHLVSETLATYRTAIQMHSRMYAKGAKNDSLQSLEETFYREFSDSACTWQQVVDALPSAVSEIQTRLVNAKSDKKLEQDELNLGSPPRLIAVGGDLLSRGLTLEGLMVSYFYRQTAASDTLMQMGRWFGYREGYEDLCRLWIDDTMVAAYSQAAQSIDELRLELAKMEAQKLTPEQYGLAVRNHPDALLITARNKMRAAKTGSKSISLRGRSIESFKLSADPKVITSNFGAATSLIGSLKNIEGSTELARKNRPIWRAVDKKLVADFLDLFQAHESMGLFQAGALPRFVRSAAADDLQTWDIVAVGGSGNELQIDGVHLYRPKRAIKRLVEDVSWLVGDKQRVAGRGDIASPLSEAKVAAVTKKYKESNPKIHNVPDSEFIFELERPTLLLYFVEGTDADTTPDEPLVGIKIAIPGLRSEAGRAAPEPGVTYSLTKAAQRLWLAADIVDDEEDGINVG